MTSKEKVEVKLLDEEKFERLRQTLLAVKEKEAHSKALLESIDDEDGLVARHKLVQSLAQKIEEKEVHSRAIKAKIEMVQKLILAKRRIMYEVQEKLDKKEKDFTKLTEKTKGLETQVNANNLVKKEQLDYIDTLTRLVSYRRVYMIKELMEIFKIDVDGGPASPIRVQTDCKCVLVDTIRGLHLPHVASIQSFPHSEQETAAAIGLVVHALSLISRILDYPLRYPIVHNSSNSRIYCPLEDKTAVLSGWRKRADRDRFFEGLGWLGKNIAQLRSDCGLPTPMVDKTLSIMADWVRSVTEGKYVTIYERPVKNLSSPSSLLINFQETAEALADK